MFSNSYQWILGINTFFELFFLFFLEGSFCPERSGPVKQHARLLIASGLSFAAFYVLNHLFGYSFPGYLFYYIAFALLFLLLTENRPTALTIALFSIVGDAYIRFCVDAFLRSFLSADKQDYFFFNIYSNLIILGLIIAYSMLLKRYCRLVTWFLPWYYQLVFITILCLLLGFLFMPYSLAENKRLFSLYMFFLLLIVLALYFFLQHISRDQEEHYNSLLTLREENLKTEHISDIQYLYQKMRVLRHEQKNSMLYIQTLLEQGEYETLHAYAAELTKSEQVYFSGIDTGNILVNAILQPFLTKSAQQHVPVEVNASLPDKLNMKDGSLVSLLSNLLDNAWENTDPKDPKIHVELKIIKSYFSITVENSVSDNILETNPLLHTTKKQADLHGIGTQVMKKIVQEYDGSIEYRCTEKLFTVNILLPIAGSVSD